MFEWNSQVHLSLCILFLDILLHFVDLWHRLEHEGLLHLRGDCLFLIGPPQSLAAHLLAVGEATGGRVLVAVGELAWWILHHHGSSSDARLTPLQSSFW